MIDRTPIDDATPKETTMLDTDDAAAYDSNHAIARLTHFAEAEPGDATTRYDCIRDLLGYTDMRLELDAMNYDTYLELMGYPDMLTHFPHMADTLIDADAYDKIHTTLIEALDDEYQDDKVSMLCISLSLCPIHYCDWASCFDDDDPDCSQIRHIFPHSHDT